MENKKTFAEFYFTVTNAYNCIVCCTEDNKWYCEHSELNGYLYGINLYREEPGKDYALDVIGIKSDIKELFDEAGLIDITDWTSLTLKPRDLIDSHFYKIGVYEIY